MPLDTDKLKRMRIDRGWTLDEASSRAKLGGRPKSIAHSLMQRRSFGRIGRKTRDRLCSAPRGGQFPSVPSPPDGCVLYCGAYRRFRVIRTQCHSSIAFAKPSIAVEILGHSET